MILATENSTGIQRPLWYKEQLIYSSYPGSHRGLHRDCVRGRPHPHVSTAYRRITKTVPLRLTVSAIATYNLAKHLTKKLGPLVGKCGHHIRNPTDFIDKLKEMKIWPKGIMVSFDVVSIFTKVSIENTTKLLNNRFAPEITKLYQLLLTMSYFL